MSELVCTRHDIDHHALETIRTAVVTIPVICTPGFDIKGLVGGRPLETVEGVLPLTAVERALPVGAARRVIVEGIGTALVSRLGIVLSQNEIRTEVAGRSDQTD